MNSTIRTIILFLLALYFPFAIVGQVKPAKAKNILIIYSDDQSYNTIHAWGNNEIQTPNLDKLSKEGMSFMQ